MMTPALSHRLAELKLEPVQQFRNLAIFPLTAETLSEPEHVLLADALAQGFLTVEEISQGGSVPELVVVNDSDHYVLLLDGEEVAGAKQNRVLNTTILLDRRSRTLIPVSCTEQGRWAYASEKFFHSGNVMSSKIRRRKSLSVSDSLKMNACFASDQGEIWSSIAELHADAGTHSPTGAMKDAYEARRDALEEFGRAFTPVADQVGLLVFIDGRAAGCDFFSSRDCFSRISAQLIQSYAMDALTSRRREVDAGIRHSEASRFLEGLPCLREDVFDSVGVGRDFRYDGATGNGSALIVGETPVHASFFAKEDGAEDRYRRPRMSSFARRRSLWRNHGHDSNEA